MNTKAIAAALAAAATLVSSTALIAPSAHAKAKTNVSVVLVHGAFADAASWDKVAAILRKKGIKTTEVQNPLTSLADDVAATKAVLAAQTGPVVLVGHSWGGVVIGESGDDPKVKALVYVAAFGLDKGESINGISAGSTPPPGILALKPNAQGMLLVDAARFPTVFADGVPAAEAEKMARDQIPTSPTVFDAKSAVAAWHVKPTYYAISTEDEMIPPAAEAMFAKRMNATTISLQSSHAAMVSHPKDVADLIIKAVEAK